jgi:hypothetical protein
LPHQISEYGLPTAPPKLTDARAFTGETCQAEALAPDQLAAILRHEIESRMDLDLYEKILEEEADERAFILKKYFS